MRTQPAGQESPIPDLLSFAYPQIQHRQKRYRQIIPLARLKGHGNRRRDASAP